MDTRTAQIINGKAAGPMTNRDAVVHGGTSGARRVPCIDVAGSILGLDITGEDVHETGLIWDSGDGDLRAAGRQADASMRTVAAQPFAARPASFPNTTLANQLWTLAQTVKFELGLQYATIDYGGWDTHDDNFDRVEERANILDQGLAALLPGVRVHVVPWEVRPPPPAGRCQASSKNSAPPSSACRAVQIRSCRSSR